ncbi:hypothetical protein B0H10DRAFT_2056944 [Mycena sp. CBHHK59/15]|nr:hypothetical protein B0H10DRAFT_2056944 [Mycena sp. CBHHK59/15]
MKVSTTLASNAARVHAGAHPSQPVAASLIPPPPHASAYPSQPLSASVSANAPGALRLSASSRWHSNSAPTPSLRAAWGEIRRGSGSGPRLDGASSPAPGPLPPAEPPPPTPAALRIALFVSMPMPYRMQDDEIPCMDFGVVEADVVDPGKMSSRPDGGGSGCR